MHLCGVVWYHGRMDIHRICTLVRSRLQRPTRRDWVAALVGALVAVALLSLFAPWRVSRGPGNAVYLINRYTGAVRFMEGDTWTPVESSEDRAERRFRDQVARIRADSPRVEIGGEKGVRVRPDVYGRPVNVRFEDLETYVRLHPDARPDE